MLCSLGGQTCGACCWGPSVSRPTLEGKLRRHRAAFERLLSPSSNRRPPGALALLGHELRARYGLDLLLAPLFVLPWLGPRLRGRFGSRVVCAFLAFRDESETRVGCLLHPGIWRGIDRRAAAFRLLPRVGCGSPEYVCSAIERFAVAAREERDRFAEAVRGLDWFHYSLEASNFKESSPCR